MHPRRGERCRMRRMLFVVCVLAILGLAGVPRPAAAVSVGDTMPNIRADSTVDGKIVPFSLKDALSQHAVVLYFFPKAFTKG